MASIDTSIDIDAPPQRVWDALLDFGSYGEWNEFLHHLDGEPRVGERLTMRLTPPDGMAMTFKPTVKNCDEPTLFSWQGRLLVRGLFDGEHIFELQPIGDDRVRFIHRENFSGVLVPLMRLIGVLRKTRPGFIMMNEALKARMEGSTDGAARGA